MLDILEPLRTPRLLLRPFTDDDLDDVAAYHSLPEVVRYLYWEVRDREQVRELLVQRRRRHRLAQEGDGGPWNGADSRAETAAKTE